MSLPPIFYYQFQNPVRYLRALSIQERLHQHQHLHRRTSTHKDILLLLQHRPVYTSGRRQSESSLESDRARLTSLGADFVTTGRGGQLTYHGPGQLVGYPLLDLSRTSPTMSVREYIGSLQKVLEGYLREGYGIETVPSEHTGVFLDERTKVGSIGVQVRHRLTTHGFALNVTREPLAWFAQVVACGLDDVKAGCIEDATGTSVAVGNVIPGVVNSFGTVFGREMIPMADDVDELEQLSQ